MSSKFQVLRPNPSTIVSTYVQIALLFAVSKHLKLKRRIFLDLGFERIQILLVGKACCGEPSGRSMW